MLTSRNNNHRWILAAIVESGNHRFWGWHELFFVTFFWLLFILRTWNQKNVFAFAWKKNAVQPLPQLPPTSHSLPLSDKAEPAFYGAACPLDPIA
jgi:hypothetical protein